jgi:hypothetical protein
MQEQTAWFEGHEKLFFIEYSVFILYITWGRGRLIMFLSERLISRVNIGTTAYNTGKTFAEK